MLSLERFKPAQQLVELRVGDDRRVADVVTELVFADLVGQLTPSPPNLGRHRVSFCRTHLRRLSEGADTPDCDESVTSVTRASLSAGAQFGRLRVTEPVSSPGRR